MIKHEQTIISKKKKERKILLKITWIVIFMFTFC